jgi:site-specific DNA-methyltransferase (adenine-specific)
MLEDELGMRYGAHVVWHYTFGQHQEGKLTRSHAHLLCYHKDPEAHAWHPDAIRVPSARQRLYKDKRANPKGRVPDDTWILRPQEAPEGWFAGESDTWHVPRVNGTFKERVDWHKCQMPEALLARIVRGWSDPGDLVLDPFSGTASTLLVAKKLGRRWAGIELSEDYAKRGFERVEAVNVGDPIERDLAPPAVAV